MLTFRPELAKRVIATILAAWSGLIAIGCVISQIQDADFDVASTAVGVFFLPMCVWFVRIARVRIVADERGIDVIDGLYRKRFDWSECQRRSKTGQ